MTLPINIEIMDVDKYVASNNLKQVTSIFIKEPSSGEFHDGGLFSESIFGQVGSTNRLISFGYIDLRTTVIHPIIYNNLIRLKALYGEILSGRSYAIFDKEQADFVRADEDDERASTGYKFFMDNFKDIVFVKNESISQNDKVSLIEKYRKQMNITKCLVMPAGIRDMNIEDGKLESGSINKLYSSLLNYTFAMPITGSDSDIFDGVRFSIQKKIGEIYDYIFDMISGKYGFFQRKYGSRNLALGTRNVISPASMAAESPEDPKYIKVDEVQVPLFQCAKMFQPLVVYYLKIMFFSDVISQFSDQVGLIDTKTLDLVYQPISEEEKTKFLSTEGLEKILDLFRDREFRYKPVMIYNEDEVPFYVFMVYDKGNSVSVVRNVTNFINKCKENGWDYDPRKLRPLTYAELLYIATYAAVRNKCATVTRYPAIEVGSDVPCKVHLMSSMPARTVEYVTLDSEEEPLILPQYPMMDESFIDSTVLHPSILKGLTADHDGNCCISTTYVNLAYTQDWLNLLDKDTRKLFENKTYDMKGMLSFCEIQIKDFPRLGEYKLDKNGAKVYAVPLGCYVSSFDPKQNKFTFEPISAITVEENCPVVMCKLRSSTVGVSTNESLAVFDNESGLIKRVTPKYAYDNGCFIPVMVGTHNNYGTQGTFDDGWFLGSMISGENKSDLSNDVGRIKILNGSEEFLCGLFCGIFENYGSFFEQRERGKYFSYVKIDVSSSNVLSNIKFLMYKLGIRINISEKQENGLYTLQINVTDLYSRRSSLKFKTTRFNAYLRSMNLISKPDDPTDVIPLTNEECRIISSLKTKYLFSVDIVDNCVERSKLLSIVDYIPKDLVLLRNRIFNKSVHWEILRSIEEDEPQRVFDFLVDTTKLFTVNEGIVIYDTISVSGVLSEEANEEIRKHLDSIERYVHTNGKLYCANTDLVELTIYNLSREPTAALAK